MFKLCRQNDLLVRHQRVQLESESDVKEPSVLPSAEGYARQGCGDGASKDNSGAEPARRVVVFACLPFIERRVGNDAATFLLGLRLASECLYFALENFITSRCFGNFVARAHGHLFARWSLSASSLLFCSAFVSQRILLELHYLARRPFYPCQSVPPHVTAVSFQSSTGRSMKRSKPV